MNCFFILIIRISTTTHTLVDIKRNEVETLLTSKKFEDSDLKGYLREKVGWLHRLDGHEFEQDPGLGDGQGGLACCSPWGHGVRHNWVTELSWRENYRFEWKAMPCFKILGTYFQTTLHKVLTTIASKSKQCLFFWAFITTSLSVSQSLRQIRCSISKVHHFSCYKWS